jgi:hypothetical protein
MTEEREQQGTGDPITVEETLPPERFQNASQAEYIDATDEVRVITDYDRSDEDTPWPEYVPDPDEPPPGEPVYDTRPFDEWADAECSSVIAKYIGGVTQRRLGENANRGDPTEGAMMIDPQQSTSGRIIGIRLTTYVNQEGESVVTPRPSFEQVVDAAPSRATVTIEFEGREYTTTFPVMVTEEFRQLPSHTEHLRADDLGQGGEYESIEDANRAVPFVFRGPANLPEGYSLTQIAVSEPSPFDGYHGRLVYQSERGDHSEDLLVSARPADDPNVPGHPYGVDCDVTVNGRPGTYARTDDEIVGSLPAGVSDPAELQNGILEFIDGVGTSYYLNGPFEKDELIRIAESIQ